MSYTCPRRTQTAAAAATSAAAAPAPAAAPAAGTGERRVRASRTSTRSAHLLDGVLLVQWERLAPPPAARTPRCPSPSPAVASRRSRRRRQGLRSRAPRPSGRRGRRSVSVLQRNGRASHLADAGAVPEHHAVRVAQVVLLVVCCSVVSAAQVVLLLRVCYSAVREPSLPPARPAPGSAAGPAPPRVLQCS